MDRSPDTDSLCALKEQCSLSQQEKSRFYTQLADYPHTFQLQDQERLGPEQLKRLKEGLKSAMSVGYKTSLETARARNMLAYLLYRLNQPEDALEQLERVLKMGDQGKNLVTLANKAVILWNQTQLSEADELVDSLTKLKTQDEEFSYLVVLAKAELAFTYSRLNPGFFPLAIIKFEEVIPRAREPEKWLWKFGLALTKRRLVRIRPQSIASVPSAESEAEQRGLLLLLMEVAKKCDCSNLKAKAYSEMAMLLFMVLRTPLNGEFCSMANMNAEQACERALTFDSKDSSVLCKCGRILRYLKKTERSRELLEEACAIRPTSTAFHHLGITYRALANVEKYKDRFQGHDRQQPAGPGQYQDYGRTNRSKKQFRQTSGEQYDRNAYGQYQNSVGSAMVDSDKNEIPLSGQENEIRVMQRMIKSPPRGVTRYSRDDKFIKEALENFEKAIEFSMGGNTRAIYDLAILQKSLGEFENAKKNLQEILNHQANLLPIDKINAYEQTGLIMKELAKSETDEVKKRHMVQNSTSMLQMALATASEVFARSPGIKEHLGELFGSFSVLLQAVEESGDNQPWKHGEKAKLFQLIRDHKQSLEFLQEIEQMDPEKSKDPKHLKLCIENHVALGQFEDALSFVKLLKSTEQSTTTIRLFEDCHYVTKLNVQAARQALLNNNLCMAQEHFRSAFTEAENISQNEENRSEYEDTDSSEDSKSDSGASDLAILFEENAESRDHATKLTTLLKTVCGLTVASIDIAPPNKLDMEGELRILKSSTMVIVLAGGKTSRRNRFYIRNIAKQMSTVTVLVGGKRVPELLKENRSLECPPELLQISETAYCGKATKAEVDASRNSFTKAEVDAICKFFSFLVKVDIDISEA